MDITAIVAVSLFTIIFVVGVPGNCLVIWVFAKKSRKTTTSFLILSLATIDLCACLIAPIHLVRSLGGVFINEFCCKFSIYGSRAFSFSAVYLTTFIALDRYMAVCKPLEIRSNARRIIAVILVSIGLAVSGNIQFALFVKPVQIGPVKKCIYRGGPDWLDLSNEIFTSISYLLALIICTCVYVRIYLEIRKQMKVRAGLVGNTVQMSLSAQRPGNTISNGRRFVTTDGEVGTNQRVTSRKCDLPKQGETMANLSGNHIQDASNSVSDLFSSGGSVMILAGSKANGSPPINPVEMGAGHLLHPKAPACVPQQDAPSADCSTYPETSTQDNAGQPTRRDMAKPSQGNRQRKERVMTRMLLGTNLILILSWLPSFILTNVPDEAVAAYRAKASQSIVVAFSYQLRTLNHIVGIFVYALLNANFRKDCKAIFLKCKK